MTTVPNFLDFTINAILHPILLSGNFIITVEHSNLYIHTDF